jgi:hypothetical protein
MKTFSQFVEEFKPAKIAERGEYSFDIKKLDQLAKDLPYSVHPIKALQWNLKYIDKGEDHDRRVKEAKLKIQYPILITKDLENPNRLDVLDGLHRLQHCQDHGIEAIPAKVIPHDMLMKAKI